MQSPDCGANYNAFGRDPNGRLAFLASFFYGPSYVPTITLQQFGGRPEPPRYGPPARYQRRCLPPGFQPKQPPNFLDPHQPDDLPEPPFLDPPKVFNPNVFAAFKHVRRFQRFMPEEEQGLTEDIDTESETDEMEIDEDESSSDSEEMEMEMDFDHMEEEKVFEDKNKRDKMEEDDNEEKESSEDTK